MMIYFVAPVLLTYEDWPFIDMSDSIIMSRNTEFNHLYYRYVFIKQIKYWLEDEYPIIATSESLASWENNFENYQDLWQQNQSKEEISLTFLLVLEPSQIFFSLIFFRHNCK